MLELHHNGIRSYNKGLQSAIHIFYTEKRKLWQFAWRITIIEWKSIFSDTGALT
jgi:hypothetical protein